jgi:hypothetical protein
VVRVKIEAAPWNEGVPRSDEDARDDLYFEHHVKVQQLTSDLRGLVTLIRAVIGHDAHVSVNARRTRADGFQERFVTQRCHGGGRRGLAVGGEPGAAWECRAAGVARRGRA